MIAIVNLSHHYTGVNLFDNISVHIHSGEKVGIVGKNGSGKTTLLNIISGKIQPEGGSVSIPKDSVIGFLEQDMSTLNNGILLEEAMNAVPEIIELRKKYEELNDKLANLTEYKDDVYNKYLIDIEKVSDRLQMLDSIRYDELVEKTLLGLGFERSDFHRHISELSGGWKMRVELAKILISRPDVILLDEPTNHLDIDSIRWLEEYLLLYKGIVIVVSHDRIFLDNICTRTIEISAAKVYDFNGCYSKFEKWKDEMIESELNLQEKQNREIAQIQQFVDRFRYKATKAKQVQSRLIRLEKIKEVEVEVKDTSAITFQFLPAPPSGKVVLEARNLSKSYGEKNVFRNLEFDILRGESVAFVGKNGEGKSTLVKAVTGDIPFEGSLKIGHNVNIGYFAQNQADLLDPNKTVFQTIDDIATGEYRTKVRGILGCFLFKTDDLDKKVSILSGGERSRLAIACMLLNPFNLLIMDEPTNHLDMISKDILKNALLHFGGTMIIVSHDRDFLYGLSTRVFDFHNHTIKQYSGGIEEYLEHNKVSNIDEAMLLRKKQQAIVSKMIAKQGNTTVSANRLQYEMQKETERQKKRLQKKIAELEQLIEKKESEMKDVEILMNSGKADSKVFENYGVLKNELDRLVEQWEDSISQSEEMQSQSESN